MGVPKFFKYISERYPNLSELVKENQLPEFDNLYLDMNGIIHVCSHPDDFDPHFRITEEKIFSDIFHYIEMLFQMIKPRELFFMAVDGVAPRAKMNQQRGRRFRSAREAEALEGKALERGETLPEVSRFDSNCITPGTVFMKRLQTQLQFFVSSKISNDKLWQRCKVILSGQETPGEGEHKIMDYIRYMKAQPGYNPNTRHCLYGLDADLIMLGLCTHEPHFSLLREEVKFGKKVKRKNIPEQMRFFLLHLSLMREYLEQEFMPLQRSLTFEYDMEKIIDDWVLMGFLVGNDFIPNLPNMHITNNALPLLYNAYMKILPNLDGYINEGGILNLVRFEKFMLALSSMDMEHFCEHYGDLKYLKSKRGPKVYYKEKINQKESEFFQTDVCDNSNEEISEEVHELINDMNLNNTKKDNIKVNTPKDPTLLEFDEEDILDNDEENSLFDSISESDNEDSINAEFLQHKNNYYVSKLDYDQVTPEVLKDQAEGYVRAIQWNLHYYYNGVCSWSWFYPHHYAPYVSDIKGFSDLKLEYELGEPFKPYEQLLAVLPSASKNLLPTAYQELMTSDESPIINFYPKEFNTDLNGKRQEWEAVVLIPFINEEQLLKAMASCNDKLTEDEKRRNTHGPMRLYQYTKENLGPYPAPEYFCDIKENHAKVTEISIDDIKVPINKLIKGPCPGSVHDVYYPGFPTFKHLSYSSYLEKAGVRVFDNASRNENMIIRIESVISNVKVEEVAKRLIGKSVYVYWPHLLEALVVAVSDSEHRYKKTNEKLERFKHKSNEIALAQMMQIVTKFKETKGIDVGDVDILVHVKELSGTKHVYDNKTKKVLVEKLWNEIESCFPLQAIVENLVVYKDDRKKIETIDDLYPVNATCFVIASPYYGSIGEIVENYILNQGRLKIKVTFGPEPDFSSLRYLNDNVPYYQGYVIAQQLMISSHLFSRITGSLFVCPGSKQSNVSNTKRHNIGLNLKLNRKNEEIPGYTKKYDNQWLYSENVITLVHKYREKFPDLFMRIFKNIDNEFFYENELFPNCEGQDKIQEVLDWLKDQPVYSVPRRQIGCLSLQQETIERIQKIVENFYSSNPEKSTIIFLKPQLLYRSELETGHSMPDPTAEFMLFDRVITVKEGYSVPLGSKGTVIGLQMIEDKDVFESMLDIVFDKPFSTIQTNFTSNHTYRLPKHILLNISHGMRLAKNDSAQRNISDQGKNINSGQNMPPYNSAFASWQTNNNISYRNAPPPISYTIQNRYNHNPMRIQPPRSINPYQGPRSCSMQVPVEIPEQVQMAMSGQVQVAMPESTSNPMQVQTSSNLQMFVPTQILKIQPRPQAFNQGNRLPISQEIQFVPSSSSNPVRTQIVSPSTSRQQPQQQSSNQEDVADLLKKMLNIEPISNSTPPKSSSVHHKKDMQTISVQDLFAHARNKEEMSPSGPSQKPKSFAAQLIAFCQTHSLEMPHYVYQTIGQQKYRAEIFLTNRRIVGKEASTKAEAAEIAARKMLNIVIKESIEEKGESTDKCETSQNTAESVNPAQFPDPPRQWYQNMQATFKNNKPSTQDKQTNGSQAREDAKDKKSTSFIPLQAVRQQRVHKLSETSQESVSETMKNQVVPKVVVEKSTPPASNHQNQVNNNMKQPEQKRKRQMAANFSKFQQK